MSNTIPNSFLFSFLHMEKDNATYNIFFAETHKLQEFQMKCIMEIPSNALPRITTKFNVNTMYEGRCL